MNNTQTVTLCPQQQEAFDGLIQAASLKNVLLLMCGDGTGRTTVLKEVHRTLGGVFLTIGEFVRAMEGQNPLSMEETFYRMIMQNLQSHEVVIMDDFHLLSKVVDSNYNYARQAYIDSPLATIADYALQTGKKIVFGSGCYNTPDTLSQRAASKRIQSLEIKDYAFLCRQYLRSEVADTLDYARIHRFAPELTAHQICGSCSYLSREEGVDTAKFIEYLRSRHLQSNVDLDEVQVVDLHDLKGVDDIIQSLEANIILPLENDALSQELGLKPKRGVLLAGPPGTGKTTVGRALAHRLKSKFFLIDGTFISGTEDFYEKIERVFHAAKQNAPSILFIDDSDVIFESGTESGLYRYLLTMLDGLESERAGRVCVMMTAMEVGNLPPALMRSGRVELWLETQLPDEPARADILHDRLAPYLAALGEVDIAQIAAATTGLTGADLKRLVEDGKLLLAYDRVNNLPIRPSTAYFLTALETLHLNQQRYMEAEARARQQHPARPPWFDVTAVMG